MKDVSTSAYVNRGSREWVELICKLLN